MRMIALLAIAALPLAACSTNDPTPPAGNTSGPWCPSGTQAVKTPGNPGPDNIVCKPYGNTD
jgi:hypothetical protein